MNSNTFDKTTTTTAHNTHYPLTGDGVTNTHNPLTGDQTAPYPHADTNAVTSCTVSLYLATHMQGTHAVLPNHNDNIVLKEQQPAGYTHTIGPHTGTHAGSGVGIPSNIKNRNTHNPLASDGVTNTQNSFTGDKAGPHPPLRTNPVTGPTKDGKLVPNEYSTGYPNTADTIGSGPHDRTIHNNERGIHTTGASGSVGTSTHPSLR
ncbi:hypothetical protein OPQ81_000527 [Rhizoctonia solani]|nr:hypothetical protein OPQ81_000527 [Rhizoctonia solani]